MSIKRGALGRGLSALLENEATDITSNITPGNNSRGVAGSVSTIPVDQIEANPFQPRFEFNEDALAGLSASIKELGIIQPVTVRKLGYDKYQLISGERRFRASQLAGLTEIPAYIRIANDQSMLEMALVENIQREELDAIEIGISFKRLIDECSLTQEALSERVGKNRSTVTNYIRLLKLPPVIQSGIKKGDITMGHARTLINIDDENIQLSLFAEIVLRQLSVRETEELVRNLHNHEFKKAPEVTSVGLSFELKKVKEDVAKMFGTKVDLKSDKKGKGSLTLHFKSEEELDRILSLIGI